MKTVTLTNCDLLALVDDEDYSRVVEKRWSINNTGTGLRVVMTSSNLDLGHYVLEDYTKKHLLDHKDRNPLNNQKNNLRHCTRGQNQMNRGKFSGNYSSKYKGVYKHRGKWLARIRKDGKFKHLGYFDIEDEAGKAYDDAAVKLFGEFAVLNFPVENNLVGVVKAVK